MTKPSWWGVEVPAVACLALAIASVACSGTPGQPRSTADVTSDSSVAKSLDAYFTKQLPADEPGGAVLIMKRDRVVFSGGYGLADLQTRQPISPRTLFNLGSISKTFVANGILILQEHGQLSVDDTLLQHFPGFKNKELASQIKIRHLLTHSSGLPDNREVNKHREFYLTAKDAENWYPITQADSLEFAPGSRFRYSNPAYNGLALIVQQVSGVKWQDFIRDRILLPAGMKTSTITDGAHPETGVAHGYEKVDGRWTESDYGEVPTFAASGNGGVWSSVEELALYEQALQNAVFLKPETIADSRTVKSFSNWADPAPAIVGWSWFIEQTPDHMPTIGHTGSQGGFICNYVTLPEKHILLIILTNSARDDRVYVKEILRQLSDVSWLD
jgi:CubicO group peptidase (beta-lactamase class C family)